MICMTVDVTCSCMVLYLLMELRKQLENQVVTIDTLHNENRLAVEHHENVTRRRINFTVDNSEPSPMGQRIGLSVSSCSLVSEKYGKLASSI
ncbi:unnamed protein product [Prunus brigantina]